MSDTFSYRHIGSHHNEIRKMLKTLEIDSLDELLGRAFPEKLKEKAQKILAQNSKRMNQTTQAIQESKATKRSQGRLLDKALSERSFLKRAKQKTEKNKLFKDYIGMGYYPSSMPSVIQRNILENPRWYTPYTPYQAEISQGRMEALLNFQTMIADLTGMEISNASLLDEGTAAAEAMLMAFRIQNSKVDSSSFFVDRDVFPQTIEILKTRAEPLGIHIYVGDAEKIDFSKNFFAYFIQYPTASGRLFPLSFYENFSKKAHEKKALVIVASDVLSLTLIKAPREWGANIAVGSTQRFGLPVSFGGPHAAYIASMDLYKRFLPGRIIGLSKDIKGNPALRLALQTREQHIRRERATSNICTAQALPATLASMYAVFHGPKHLKKIAFRIHFYTNFLFESLKTMGLKASHSSFFDTLLLPLKENQEKFLKKAFEKEMLFFASHDEKIHLSLNETSTAEDVLELLSLFQSVLVQKNSSSFKLPFSSSSQLEEKLDQSFKDFLKRKTFNLGALSLPPSLFRGSNYLTHSVFNSYHSETEMLRYITRLESKDLSLSHSMIPLGSCTMKLNGTSEMIPITWEGLSQIHPFSPMEISRGYQEIIQELEESLCELTGFSAISFQPNAGSQGEYAGLLMIRKYFQSKGEERRDICLIPSSAHGTNPASATMAGLKVVIIQCDRKGNIDFKDLKEKADKYSHRLATLMVTYPSTHGVFEENILDITDLIHSHGAQVYMDGANFNALVGCIPLSTLGADLAHLNLHKTFCIPHGGGGPGVGPLVVSSHLKDFLPSHRFDFYQNGHFKNLSKDSSQTLSQTQFQKTLSRKNTEENFFSISSSPWGNANVLPISWGYLLLMGKEGLRKATSVAILNANYIVKKLEPYYPILYRGRGGWVAHECILDLRAFKASVNVTVEDIAKRLMDYGFHAPTMSWPVLGTLMIEPTESESLTELNRFIEAMIEIRKEIEDIESGKADREDNVLKNAPHTIAHVCSSSWPHSYSREKAVFPIKWLRREHKFWPSVSRIDNVHGDRNLVCNCPPVSSVEE